VPSKKASAFRKAGPSGVNEVYGSAVSGNISSAIKLTPTVTWITSIGTRQDMDGVRRASDWPHSSFHAFRRRGIYSIRRVGVARTSQVLRQGSNAAMRFSSFTASCACWTVLQNVSRPLQGRG
jgi:hypothetical protein